MRNSPVLPIVGLVFAAALAIVVAITHDAGPLTELELGGIAGAITLTVYGLQGLISVAVEGTELKPGRMRPHLTDPLSLAIALLSLGLLVVTGFLAYGLTSDWSAGRLGWLAGAGCLVLALMSIFYKEAFVGDEACFDDREDGVPW